ncbi:MAG: HD domain-containing protein [Candidatus Cyclobacteriaceae bacterium M3_2C_046]
MDWQKLQKQIDFIVEADKIKQIYRKNYITDGSRTENDAEHSWHLTLMAVLLLEHANQPQLELLKVVKMLLIHDIVEIDAGDAYVYDDKAKAVQHEKEVKAADRLFALLPEEQAQEYRRLWDEFELKETAEAKFANALDRFHPTLMNYHSGGISWKENKIKRQQVINKNEHMEEGSASLWEYCVKNIIDQAARQGYFSK